MVNKLKKSNTDIFLFGVCSGIGEFFDLAPYKVRIIFLVTCLYQGLGLVLYILLAIFLDKPIDSTNL